MASVRRSVVKESLMKRSSRRNRISSRVVAVMLATLGLAGVVGAQAEQLAARRMMGRPAGPAPGPGGVVNLPYMVNDNAGNQWRIYQGGWMQQQGNMPLYSQGAMLMVNGAQPAVNVNTAPAAPETGELVFENMNANGMGVTRRVLIDKEGGFV